MSMRGIALALVVLLAPTRLFAQEPEPLGHFGLRGVMGIGFGGDEVVSAGISNLFGGERVESIHAGDGTSFGLGLSLAPLRAGRHSLELGVDQSVKYWSINARNADITLFRFPLSAGLRYVYALDPPWQLVGGGGIVYEYGIKLRGSGDAEGLDIDFEPALGGYGEGGVGFRERGFSVHVTLRYTAIQYTLDLPLAPEIDANNVALMVAGHYFF